MAAKLAVIIVVIGATFAALLVNRQQRIDVVAEISRAQLREERHGKTLLRLHAAVAEAVRPEELRMHIGRTAIVWQPIPHRFAEPERRMAPNTPRGAERLPAGRVEGRAEGGAEGRSDSARPRSRALSANIAAGQERQQ